MNKKIKFGDRVSGEFEPILLDKPVIKVFGFYEGINGRGLAMIVSKEGLVCVVPSSLRRLVKKKKPETFTTSKGFVFTKTPLGWIDETSKLEWMNEFKAGMNHYDSEKWAADQKMRLATREEFIEAESHGIRELPGMTWKGYWFWSSTLRSDNSDFACVFDGGYGNVDIYGIRGYGGIRVVARAVRKA